MAEINRKSVLLECLSIMREELSICSTNYNGLEPKKGMEEAWQQGRKKVEILQELIHAYDNEQVRSALADWQKELMAKGIQTELKFDEERYPEEHVLHSEEAQRIPGGDDPVFGGSAVEHQPVGRVEDADPGERQEHRGENRRGNHAVQSGSRAAAENDALNHIGE